MAARPAARIFQLQASLNRAMSEDLFGGPRVLKMSWVINAQKGGTAPFVLALMAYFGNWSTDAWIYLALHGSYGILWITKDVVFPDPNWQKRVTVGGALTSFLMVLGPYWSFSFLLISGVLGARPPASPMILGLAVAAHTLGVALMFGADAQKYFTLKHARGLITTGFFSRVRHPNYLGEMMLYGAYAVLVRHWLPWAVLGWVWLQVFLPNMKMKEASMSRHPGWDAYVARTGLLLPKLFPPAAPAAPSPRVETATPAE
jgi:protein-S-isoprenylcysteine O-methyltransferase Ste14